MAMDKATKLVWQNEMGKRLSESNCVILAEFRGLTVAQLTDLRVQLKKANAEFRVTKNRLLKRAIDADQKQFTSLTSEAKGPTGTVFIYGDAAQAAKSVIKFTSENELFKLKAVVMDGQAISLDQLKAVSDLPSKEVFLAQIIGSLASPSRGLVTTLSGVTRKLVNVINAIKDKKTA